MRSMVLGVVAACVLGAASLAASDALDAVVGPYLQIQAKLASDSIDGIKAPARQIAEHAPALGERGAAIAKAASAVEAATDLKTARDARGLAFSRAARAGTRASTQERELPRDAAPLGRKP